MIYTDKTKKAMKARKNSQINQNILFRVIRCFIFGVSENFEGVEEWLQLQKSR